LPGRLRQQDEEPALPNDIGSSSSARSICSLTGAEIVTCSLARARAQSLDHVEKAGGATARR
jgi:hypothetical protein